MNYQLSQNLVTKLQFWNKTFLGLMATIFSAVVLKFLLDLILHLDILTINGNSIVAAIRDIYTIVFLCLTIASCAVSLLIIAPICWIWNKVNKTSNLTIQSFEKSFQKRYSFTFISGSLLFVSALILIILIVNITFRNMMTLSVLNIIFSLYSLVSLIWTKQYLLQFIKSYK
ncbi:hypothetical protein [Mycoplasma sp. 392]